MDFRYKKNVWVLRACLAMLTLPCMMKAQSSRPTIMVIPADVWCKEHGYMLSNSSPDYIAALQTDFELLSVISKVGELMADRGFPLKDFGQSLQSGDSLLQRVKSDVRLEVSWKINKIGPKNSLTYIMRGLDAYTSKQVAAASGTGKPSFACEIPVLLEEAVLEQMDDFCAQLQQYFEDIQENGREVGLRIKIDNSCGVGLSLDSEFNGLPLADIIEVWIAENVVNQQYSLSEVDDETMLFEQLRIPTQVGNGLKNDARRFASSLGRYLGNYGLKAKVVASGHGRTDLIIGRQL